MCIGYSIGLMAHKPVAGPMGQSFASHCQHPCAIIRPLRFMYARKSGIDRAEKDSHLFPPGLEPRTFRVLARSAARTTSPPKLSRANIVFRCLAISPPLFFPHKMAAKDHRLSWHCRFLTQRFGTFLVLHVSFCNKYNCVALKTTEMTNALSVFLSFSWWDVWWEKWAIPAKKKKLIKKKGNLLLYSWLKLNSHLSEWWKHERIREPRTRHVNHTHI